MLFVTGLHVLFFQNSDRSRLKKSLALSDAKDNPKMKGGSERTAPRNSAAFTVWIKLPFLGERVCRSRDFEVFSKSCSKIDRLIRRKLLSWIVRA